MRKPRFCHSGRRRAAFLRPGAGLVLCLLAPVAYAARPMIAESFDQNRGKFLYQVGLRHWLTPGRMQIDTTYGNRFGRNTEERWFSIGLRLLPVPFLP